MLWRRSKSYWILHASALLDGRVSKMFLYKLLNGIPVIPEEEIEKAKNGLRKDIAVHEIEALEKFGLLREKSNFIKAVKKYRGCGILNDKDLEKRLKIRNLCYFSLHYLQDIMKRKYIRGEVIPVRILKNNTGYTEDGAKVIIKDREYREDEKVKCKIEEVVDGPEITTIFCRGVGKNG